MDEEFRKSIPNDLYLMTFSSNLSKTPDLELLALNIQELITTLMYKFKFQYIMIHCPSDATQEIKKELYYIAEQINIITTQNITDLIFSKKEFDKITNTGQEEKVTFVINKFCKSSVSKDIIDEMLEQKTLTFDNFHKEIVESNFKGVPLIIESKKVLSQTLFKKVRKV